MHQMTFSLFVLSVRHSECSNSRSVGLLRRSNIALERCTIQTMPLNIPSTLPPQEAEEKISLSLIFGAPWTADYNATCVLGEGPSTSGGYRARRSHPKHHLECENSCPLPFGTCHFQPSWPRKTCSPRCSAILPSFAILRIHKQHSIHVTSVDKSIACLH